MVAACSSIWTLSQKHQICQRIEMSGSRRNASRMMQQLIISFRDDGESLALRGIWCQSAGSSVLWTTLVGPMRRLCARGSEKGILGFQKSIMLWWLLAELSPAVFFCWWSAAVFSLANAHNTGRNCFINWWKNLMGYYGTQHPSSSRKHETGRVVRQKGPRVF